MSSENRLLVYEKYSEILEGIFGYQNQQVDLREMCLKIMLGTFALVGGLLFVKVEVSGQSLLIISALFPLLSLIIITVILVVDLIYKERLKLAFMSEALRLEETYKWLPKFHLTLATQNNKSHFAADGQIIFYLGSAALLMLMSAISLSIDPVFSSMPSKIVIMVSYTLLYVFYQGMFSRLVKKTDAVLRMFHNE